MSHSTQTVPNEVKRKIETHNDGGPRTPCLLMLDMVTRPPSTKEDIFSIHVYKVTSPPLKSHLLSLNLSIQI